MNTDDLQTVLEESGFSPYQADAYAALVELGSASASEIATVSGVPQPRIYDILRALEDEGYVTTYDRDRLYARANDPAQALSGLREAVGRYEAAIEEIESRYQTPETENGQVSLVRRHRTVFEHAREAIELATDHIQLAATPDQFSRLHNHLRLANERGVQVQLSLYAPSDAQVAFDQSDFEGVCTEVRQRDLHGPFLLLVDRQRVCYATDNRLSDEYGVLVNDFTTAHVFHWYFLTRFWELYEAAYNDRTEQPPYSFVEITACVRELESLLDDKVTVSGRVLGEFIRTGRECDLSGRFVDVGYTGSQDDGSSASLAQLAAEARIHFETDEDSYVIGGQGASTEDIAARRLTIEQIDSDDA